MNKVVQILLVLVIMAVTVFIFVAIQRHQRYVPCQSITIRIKTPLKSDFTWTRRSFLTEKDVHHLIAKHYTDSLIGQSIKKVNLHKIEKIIAANPYVSHVEAFTDVEGNISITVTEKEPILRVINIENVSYYLTPTGERIPLCDNFTPRVLVANGYIQDNFNRGDTILSPLLRDLLTLASYIRSDKWLNAMIAQVYVNNAQEIELIPRVGSHVILLGNISDMKEKINKLKLFYKQGIVLAGWDKYKVINLKYQNQIVCTKFN